MKNVFKILTKLWEEEEGKNPFVLPNKNQTFILKYKSLEIGRLVLKDTQWVFYYSNEFKQQNKIAPIIGFSNKEKVYESPALWPFFSYRIPSVKRPEIIQILEREKIDATDILQLLVRFGQSTIANPFHLIPQ